MGWFSLKKLSLEAKEKCLTFIRKNVLIGFRFRFWGLFLFNYSVGRTLAFSHYFLEGLATDTSQAGFV